MLKSSIARECLKHKWNDEKTEYSEEAHIDDMCEFCNEAIRESGSYSDKCNVCKVDKMICNYRDLEDNEKEHKTLIQHITNKAFIDGHTHVFEIVDYESYKLLIDALNDYCAFNQLSMDTMREIYEFLEENYCEGY